MTFGNKKEFRSGAADDEKFFVSSKSPERARGGEGRGGPGSLQSSACSEMSLGGAVTDGRMGGRCAAGGRLTVALGARSDSVSPLPPSSLLPPPGCLAGGGRARRGAGEAGGAVHSFVEDRCCSSSAGRALHGYMAILSVTCFSWRIRRTSQLLSGAHPTQAGDCRRQGEGALNRRNLVMCTFLRSSSFGRSGE